MKASFKLGGAQAREALAALIPLAPFYARPRLEDQLAKVTPMGIRIDVDKTKPQHTDNQRGFYHLCVDRLAKHLGMTHAELHEAVLCEWAGSKQVQVMVGRWVDVPLERSANLTVEAYNELIGTLEMFYAFNNVPFPDPAEV